MQVAPKSYDTGGGSFVIQRERHHGVHRQISREGNNGYLHATTVILPADLRGWPVVAKVYSVHRKPIEPGNEQCFAFNPFA